MCLQTAEIKLRLLRLLVVSRNFLVLGKSSDEEQSFAKYFSWHCVANFRVFSKLESFFLHQLDLSRKCILLW